MLRVNHVDLHRKQFGLIMKGQEGRLPVDLMWRGKRVANRADAETHSGRRRAPGRTMYEAVAAVGPTRCRVTVRSVVPVAVAYSPLLRALDAGKGQVIG